MVETLHVTITLLVFLVICSLLAILFYLLLQNKKKEKRFKQLQREFNHLEQQFSILVERHQQLKEFRNSMNEAEITTRLQTPRIISQKPIQENHKISEKYRFILALSEKGMQKEEIASSLSLSLQEVEQVLTLSALNNS